LNAFAETLESCLLMLILESLGSEADGQALAQQPTSEVRVSEITRKDVLEEGKFSITFYDCQDSAMRLMCNDEARQEWKEGEHTSS
jgi:hypothetical protein